MQKLKLNHFVWPITLLILHKDMLVVNPPVKPVDKYDWYHNDHWSRMDTIRFYLVSDTNVSYFDMNRIFMLTHLPKNIIFIDKIALLV